MGERLEKYKHDKKPKELNRIKMSLEKYIAKYMDTPLSYRLIKQRVNLPLYVLSQKTVLFQKKQLCLFKRICG